MLETGNAGELSMVCVVFWGKHATGHEVCVRVCRSATDSGSILETCAAETFLSYLLFPAMRR